jgi:hypothetical protein
MSLIPAVLASLPVPRPIQPPGTGDISTVMGWVMWLGLALCILGLIAAGAMMAVNSRRGEGGEHAGRIGMVMGGVIVIGAAGALIGFLAS